MRIERIYITHTVYCSGWNLDNILENTIFRKAMHTHQKYETGIKMLDWDFKKPDHEEHLQKAKTYDFEVVMAPDVWSEEDINFSRKMADKLSKYVDRVVIPIHYYDENLSGYELAYPNARKFNPKAGKNLSLLWEFRDQVTHILGGSPHSQLKLAKHFPNLKSLDGNLIFWSAVHYGRFWDWGWKKPHEQLSNEEIFKISVRNFQKAIEEVRR